MKTIISGVLLVLTAVTANAQKFHVTLFGGFANYQGDLQDKRFTLNQSHPAFGAGILYEITDKFYGRANVTIGKISGDDKDNRANASRNLNFSSSLTDIHLGLQYYVINPYLHSLAPYIFAGISHFNFNPYTTDTLGRKAYLQPLSTEGQGFYQDRKKYSLSQFSIPFGGGLTFSVSEKLRIGVEVGLRKTNTDYLDDVSTTYVDQALLLTNRGARAVELAYRGDELKTGSPYPADGAQRGSAKSKDWYYFSGINVSIRLGNKGNEGSRGKSKLGCPANIY